MEPCVKCRVETNSVVDVEMDDGTQTHMALCLVCEPIVRKQIDEWRRQYLFLLGNGISPQRADEIMDKRVKAQRAKEDR